MDSEALAGLAHADRVPVDDSAGLRVITSLEDLYATLSAVESDRAA